MLESLAHMLSGNIDVSAVASQPQTALAAVLCALLMGLAS